MPADAAATSSSSVSSLQQQIDELSVELRARTVERDEIMQRERALAEVLQVINASGQVPAAVFDAILEKAMRLCAAAFGYLMLYEDERFRVVASHSLPARFAEYLRNMDQPGPTGLYAAIRRGSAYGQVADLRDGEVYRTSPLRRALVDLGGARTGIVVALRKDDTLLGVITIYRQEVRPFAESEIALLKIFSEQATIALENGRLLSELRQRTHDLSESLDYQTATSEVLNVISRSGDDLEPVMSAILAAAARLCGTTAGTIAMRRDGTIRVMATLGFPPEVDAAFRGAIHTGRDTMVGRTMLDRRVVHVHDMAVDPDYGMPDMVRLGRIRTALGVPLLRDGEWVGAIAVSRDHVRPFSDRQVSLIETFADQAVIAMENARLLRELRQRTDDLQESLEYQTATNDVLAAISRSTGELDAVLQALVETAARICKADTSAILRQHEGRYHVSAAFGVSQEWIDFVRMHPIEPGRGTVTARVALERRVIHVEDVTVDPEYALPRAQQLGAFRTALGVPLMREGAPIGVIALGRARVEPFTERQIALVQTFADQAVIAMENARLLNEQREALERQTATAEVLQTINTSPGNLEPVFMSVLEKALRLCEAAFGVFWTYDGNHFHASALLGVPTAFADFARQRPHRVGNDNTHARALRGEAVMHIVDAAESEAYRLGDPLRRALVDLGGARTSLGVALRKEDALLGVLILYRKEVRPFSERQIGLIESFASQAVVAMENARLLDQLHQRTDDLARSVDELSATGDVLKTISRSSTDLKAVLDTLLETVARLCRADQTYMFRRHEELHHLVAAYGVPPEGEEYIRTHPFTPERSTTSGRVALEGRTVHIEDVLSDPEYTYTEGQSTAGFRTMLGLPLLRENVLAGVFVLGRTRVEPFSQREIELAGSFADQAVIAIENARLFEELRDRQAELRVTFDNMGDGVAMFDAERRLGAWNRNFERIMGLSEEWLAKRPDYAEYLEILAERGEFGTANVEAELASRLEDTERELRLERTRPDGSVIEVRRNAVPGGGFVLIYSDITERRRAEAEIRAARDAAEAALERQTATADILKVIAGSPTDVQPVLDALVKSAVRFCGATDATISLRDGNEIVRKAHEGPLGTSIGVPLDGDSASATAIRSGRTVHYQDIAALDPVAFAAAHRRAAQDGYRAALAAPMIRDGVAIGNIALRKVEAGAFTAQQIALLETFAAQAVIAIENVRLFNDLREALEQQTATADILRIISQSPTDVTPVLTAVAGAALKFCGARDAQVALRSGDTWSIVAHEGPIGVLGGTRRLSRQTAPGRAMVDGEVVQIVDLQSAEADEFQEARELGARLGFRSALAAPLLRDDVAIGAISLRRPEAGVFTASQVELLKSFAAQAVIAIENVRLFTELRDSLERLKAAQANLIQSEKMASLGQLTAGIAHEIKNPLNFVNNFAGLSSELLDELRQAVEALLAEPDEGKRAELQETMDLLTANLARIVEHGKRADGIVRSMLSHSRGGSGDWQESNINALVEEALSLAYHGARALDKDFNTTLQRDLAPEMKVIEVVPQDVTRVFLNLFGNGFYATRKRHLGGAEAGYRPTLKVSTRDLGEAVEIRVRDNGTGIQPDLRARLFQPFFTTKPTGEGTGLGLSISYDIVTQQHGGTIEVESEPGSFTEFTVRLPRGKRISQSRGA